MTVTDDAAVSEAIVLWTGYGRTTWPARDEERLVVEFGSELATELVPLVRQREDDFYRSEARLTAVDLETMAAVASAEFRALHPETTVEAVAALAWCYTFDYK